jgi:mediator of RNA polymerase II transcription subunit 8, fungi type
LAIHPSTNFPGRTQEGILLQLLRKKPEPDVEETMDKGRRALTASQDDPESLRNEELELQDAWDKARRFCIDRVMQYATEEDADPFTAEEREMGVENVRTGLKRSLEDDDDDDDDDEGGESAGGDAMVVDRPPPPPAPAITTNEVEGTLLENTLRYASRGDFIPG